MSRPTFPRSGLLARNSFRMGRTRKKLLNLFRRLEFVAPFEDCLDVSIEFEVPVDTWESTLSHFNF